MGRLTVADVRSAKPRDSRYELRDDDVRGLLLRVNVDASKTFAWRGTVRDGPKVTVTIGNADTVTLAEARTRALEIRGMARGGRDPRQGRRAIPERVTAADLVEDYLDAFVQRAAPTSRGAGLISRHSLRSETSAIDRASELLGSRALNELTVADARALRDAAQERGAASARHTFGAASRLLEFAVERGNVESNPFRLVRAPRPAPARTRSLSPAEFWAIWEATGALHPDVGRLIRFLMVTPLRASDAAGLRYHQVDGDLVRLARTKRTGEWIVPMPRQAIELVGAGEPDQLLFASPGRRGRNIGGVFKGWSKTKVALDRESGVAGWRIHDFRRTIVSRLADDFDGYDPAVAELWLQHAPPGIVGVYQVSGALPGLRRHAAAWSDVLDNILST